jgi:hypothetical protein
MSSNGTDTSRLTEMFRPQDSDTRKISIDWKGLYIVVAVGFSGSCVGGFTPFSPKRPPTAVGEKDSNGQVAQESRCTAPLQCGSHCTRLCFEEILEGNPQHWCSRRDLGRDGKSKDEEKRWRCVTRGG